MAGVFTAIAVLINGVIQIEEDDMLDSFFIFVSTF